MADVIVGSGPRGVLTPIDLAAQVNDMAWYRTALPTSEVHRDSDD